MTLGESWSLLDKSGKDRGWRPGGYNLLAVNRANKRLYVGMHPNGAEGTHKTPAAEIWVYDLTTRSAWRASRQGALSMSVSQDDKPRLFTIDGGNVNVHDAAPVAPVLKGAIKGAGETALQVEPQTLAGSREMTDPVFYSASAALACVLLLGALDKFRDLPGFAAAVSAHEIPPAGIGAPFALLLALAEVAAGALLLTPAWQPAGAAWRCWCWPRPRPGWRSTWRAAAATWTRLRRPDVAPARRARHRTVLVAGGAQRGAGGLDRAGAGGRRRRPVARPAVDGRRVGVRPGRQRRRPVLHGQPPVGFASQAASNLKGASHGCLDYFHFLLWGVLLCLVLVILALSRQIGVLYERVAPMGALTMDRGPAVGEAAPRFDINDLLGRPVAVGGGGAQSQLLFFLSPSCPVQEAAAHPEVGGRDRACVVAHRAGQRRRDAGAPGVLPPGGLERFRICCPPSWA